MKTIPPQPPFVPCSNSRRPVHASTAHVVSKAGSCPRRSSRKTFTSLGAALLAGGILGLAGPIARAADGDVDPTFNPDASGHVSGMAVQADGKILLGGAFTTVGGVARGRRERDIRPRPRGRGRTLQGE